MRIWIDTEFNGYRGELISMALVAEDGREWYEVVGCACPVPWVEEYVMPILGRSDVSMQSLQDSLHVFLSAYDAVHIVADWPDDIRYFCEALITGPGQRINTPPLTMEIRRDIDSSKSLLLHNALADARALRDADQNKGPSQ